MADRNLIAGAAALAQSQAAKSLGFGAGLAQEATRIASNIIKREEERKAQVKNDMNLAAQFIGKMASTGTASGQYKSILTSEAMATKNRLNEIALDQSLNAVEKAAEYTKAVDEYNVLASTYAGDQEKLITLQSVVRAGNYSNTVNRNTEEFQIARALGTGDYEIVKDGYMVNGKKITSAELNNYIGLYEPKNIEGFATFDGQLRNSIRQAKGNKQAEQSILNEVLNIPSEQKLKYLVDYKEQAYNNFVNENNEINEDAIDTAYLNEMNKLRAESAIDPIIEMKTVPGSDIYQSVVGTTERYIKQNNLGEQMQTGGLKLDNKEIIQATEPDENGNMTITLQVTMQGGTLKGQDIVLNVNNPDHKYLIDKAFAEKSYSGKTFQEFNTFYLNNLPNLIIQNQLENQIIQNSVADTNTTTVTTDYPDFIKNASTKQISASEAKKFIGKRGNESIGNDIITTIQKDYEGVYSEKNIREAAWDNNAQGTDAEGRFIGKQQFEAGGLKSETKKEKVNLLLEISNTTPATKLTKNERDNLSNKDRKDLKEFGIVTQIAGVTKKDLAILEYMREAGFKKKTQYEEALASIDTGGLPINNKS